MGFIRRAGLYCIRNKIKTIILFCVLTVITSLLFIGIAIQDSTNSAASSVQKSIGGRIMLELDTDGHMGNGDKNQWGTVYGYNGDLITKDIVQAISNVDGVIDYNSEDTAAYYGAGVDFDYLPAAFGLSYTQYGEASAYTATLSSDKCTRFQSGEYKLVNGRHITPDDTHACLISKELADYNKLSVGDSIKLYSLDTDVISEFEIVGIYDGTEGTYANALTVDEIPANCGYIDYETMFELFKDELCGYQQLTIYVEDPERIQSTYNQIAELPELKGRTLKLTIDTTEYDIISKPLKSAGYMTNKIIVFISVVSTVILTLLMFIWIKGRIREIGILLSMGKRRADIILQILVETFSVAVLSFWVSIWLSYSVAEKAGEIIFQWMTENESDISIHINSSYMLPVCGIEILLILISVIVSSWIIVRLNPKEILVKMN